MTTLTFNSSRDFDITCGICIGRGYTVQTVPAKGALFAIRVSADLSNRQIEFIKEQATAMRDTATYNRKEHASV